MRIENFASGATVGAQLGQVFAQRGDTFNDLAQRYGVSEAALRAANPSLHDRMIGGEAVHLPAIQGSSGVHGGSASFDVRLLRPGESIRGSLFFGGAGMDGAYIKDMVRAFGEKGIQLTPVDREKWSGGTALDAAVGVDIYRTGKFPMQVLLDNFHQSGSQFNLVGYSYGSVAAAQVAINYAQAGTKIDNLVLVGSPISQKFLQELKSNPNIKNVVVVDITSHGDPIHAGMTRNELVKSAPTLLKQMAEGSGHFYYAPNSTEGMARRNALAAELHAKGLR